MNNDNRPRKVYYENILAFKELDKAINERIENITDEFKIGLNLIKQYPRSVTFFGSARTVENENDYLFAKNLAKRISTELGYAVVTGGGPGIMGAANQGAFEANGRSVGFTIKLPTEQITNPFLTAEANFKYFFSRKVCLTFAAEAYVYFPGGFGTMDELFEILTLVQTKKIEKVPVILVGKEFWTKFDLFIKENLLGQDKIDQEDVDLYTITDDENEIIEIIKKSPIRIE